MKTSWISLGVFLVAMGCAGSPVREGGPPPSPGETVIDLRAGTYFFDPAVLTLPAEKPVLLRVQNESYAIPHSFVLENPKGVVLLRQPLMKAGETYIRLSPLPAGTYIFYCGESLLGSTHREKGMAGKLTVR